MRRGGGGGSSKAKRRAPTIFDPSNEGTRFRRRQSDHATMMIQSNILLDCFDIVAHLMEEENAPPFNVPVDWRALNIPTYPMIIKNPMDMGTVKEMLLDSTIDSHEKFIEYMRLVFANAMQFNAQGSDIWLSAKELNDELEIHYAELAQRHGLANNNYNYTVAARVAPPQPTPSRSRAQQHTSSSSAAVRSPSPGLTSSYGSNSSGASVVSSAYVVTTPEEDDDDEITSMKEKIESLRGSVKKINEMIADEKARQARAAQEARNRPPPRLKLLKPVSFEERQQLVFLIPQLDQADLPELLEIVRAAAAQSDSDEIEIDIENMDAVTFRKVQKFVERSIAARQQQQPETAAAAPADQMQIDDTAAAQTAAPVAEEQQQPAMMQVETAQPEPTPAAVEEQPQQQHSSENVTTSAPAQADAMDVDVPPTEQPASEAPMEAAPAPAAEEPAAATPAQPAETVETAPAEVQQSEAQPEAAPQQEEAPAPMPAEAAPEPEPATDDTAAAAANAMDDVQTPAESEQQAQNNDVPMTDSESEAGPLTSSNPGQLIDDVAETSAATPVEPEPASVAVGSDAMDTS